MELNLTELKSLWPGLAFASFCFVITWFVKVVAEGLRPSLKVWHIWNEVIMPTLPVVVGAVTAVCMKSFPYPMEHPSWSTRFLLGVVAGYASAWAVRIVKAIIKAKTGVDVDAPPTPPPANVVKP